MIKIDSDKFNQCDECEKFNVALIEFNQGIYGYSQICQDCLIKAILELRPINADNQTLLETLNEINIGTNDNIYKKQFDDFIKWVKPFLESKE